MKTCSECKLQFHTSNFYRNRSKPCGLDSYCKDCTRLKYRDKRERNRKNYREKDKRYYKDNRDKISEKRKSDYEINKHKHQARAAVQSAIRKGDMERGLCQECGDRKSEAHHPNYSKPLEVVWLCKTHHARVHWS